jgi:hypothetical protein
VKQQALEEKRLDGPNQLLAIRVVVYEVWVAPFSLCPGETIVGEIFSDVFEIPSERISQLLWRLGGTDHEDALLQVSRNRLVEPLSPVNVDLPELLKRDACTCS